MPGFDAFVEDACAAFCAKKMGRPSMAPAVCSRLLLVGYFEGLDSESDIAWRLGDSLSLRKFCDHELTDSTPGHSTISGTPRFLIDEVHSAVFGWVRRSCPRRA